MNLNWTHLKLSTDEPKPAEIVPAVQEAIEHLVGEALPAPRTELRIPINKILADIEVYCLEAALKHTAGNKNQAAKVLGINRTTLVEKLKKWGLAATEGQSIDPIDFDADNVRTSLDLDWISI